MGVIYKVISPSNKIYIGKTQNFRRRLISHRYSAKKNGSSIILINSFQKYGFDNHIFEIIEEVENYKLDEREIFWIKEYNSYRWDNPNGMNMTLGGDGQRGIDSRDSVRLEQLYKNLHSNGNPFLGKHHTEENKKLLSKLARERNLAEGKVIPQWGVEKGRLKVIKSVIAYDNNGDFISEYVSLTECAKSLNIKRSTVSDSLKWGSWIFGKYKIKYKTDNYLLKIDNSNIKVKTEKRPVLYIKGKKIIEYASALEASIKTGIPKTTINRSSLYNNLNPIRTGHIFIYKDLYEKMIS